MTASSAPARTCRHCGVPLSRDARVCGGCGEEAAADERPYATTDLEAGEVLEGTWRLEQIIGRGGMGAVFSATDLSLRRRVAVKALSAQLADQEFVTRFEREARVLGILDHPNIVTLHWVGRHRGVPFIVMKLLEGEPLRRYAEGLGGRLSPAQILPLARQLCSALSYIHCKGVIHRDLKPSNIMVAPSGHLTVFDLGIARPHDSNLTRTGVIFGTPGYMSPELIVGDRNLDGRLDIYALGVILFELLVGEAPFKEGAEESLLRAHLTKPRPDPAQLRPDLPAALGRVVQKAMAIEPKDRYLDAGALLADLERACGPAPAAEPTRVARMPAGERPRPVPRTPSAARRAPTANPGAASTKRKPSESAAEAQVRPPSARRLRPAASGPRDRAPAAHAAPPSRAKRPFALAAALGLALVAALAVPAFVLVDSLQPSSPGGALPVEAPRTPIASRSVQAYRGIAGSGELQVRVFVRGREVSSDISVDGVRHGRSPALVPVSPGRKVLRVVQDRYPPARFVAQVKEGESVRLEVELEPEAARAPGTLTGIFE